MEDVEEGSQEKETLTPGPQGEGNGSCKNFAVAIFPDVVATLIGRGKKRSRSRKTNHDAALAGTRSWRSNAAGASGIITMNSGSLQVVSEDYYSSVPSQYPRPDSSRLLSNVGSGIITRNQAAFCPQTHPIPAFMISSITSTSAIVRGA